MVLPSLGIPKIMSILTAYKLGDDPWHIWDSGIMGCIKGCGIVSGVFFRDSLGKIISWCKVNHDGNLVGISWCHDRQNLRVSSLLCASVHSKIAGSGCVMCWSIPILVQELSTHRYPKMVDHHSPKPDINWGGRPTFFCGEAPPSLACLDFVITFPGKAVLFLTR